MPGIKLEMKADCSMGRSGFQFSETSLTSLSLDEAKVSEYIRSREVHGNFPFTG